MKFSKTFIILAFTAVCSLSASATGDLKDLLNSVSSGSSDKGSNPLGAIGNAISNLTASSKFELADLRGTWNYESPAVTFKSDNALQKVGGAAAATTIENKIAPYYQKAGVTALKLTVDENNNFTMSLKKGTLKGTVSKDEQGNLQFNFNAFGKIKLGKISAYATKSGKTLNLTFDVSKLISIVKTISSVSGISSLNTISSLLSSYDGIYAGFKLKAN